MELRVLNYFLATAQEQNMTRAAEKLLVSQPALSRQIADLEDELGVKLFIRQSRKLILTPAGRYLQEQAREILTLADKTKQNLQSTSVISGDLTIGAGESYGMQRVMSVVSDIIKDYPLVNIDLFSGSYATTEAKLNNGTIDFAVIMGDLPLTNYEVLQLPEKDQWGVLMPASDPLANKAEVRAGDLVNRQILISMQAKMRNRFQEWFGNYYKQINIIGNYNLVYNASLMAENNSAIVMTYDRLTNTNGRNLVFRPLAPAQYEPINVIWKHETALSPVAQLFLKRLKASIQDSEN